MTRASAIQVDEQAVAWVVARDRGLSAAESVMLEAWLAEDERHLGAYVRASALFMRTERAVALGPSYRREDFRHDAEGRADPQDDAQEPVTTARWTRRHFVGAGLAASAVGLVGGGMLLYRGLRPERFETRLGEVRMIALADGSTITLNTSSSVLVDYRATGRSIALERGEALFDVAKDPRRPFVVRTGMLDVTAVGTSFTVSHLGQASARVVVAEGVVEARNPLAVRPTALRLDANMAAVASSSAPMRASEIASTEIERELLWREGRIQFENNTLQEAANQFSRYSDVAIEIDDADLRSQQISGSFRANDPVGFCRAVSEVFGARVLVQEGIVRIQR